MKHRITIAAIATTAAFGGACAFLVPAASASTAVKSHTITFTSVQEAVHNYSRTVSSQQDRDVNKAGRSSATTCSTSSSARRQRPRS